MACNCYASEKIKMLHAMYGNIVDTSKSDKLAYRIKYKIIGIKLFFHNVVSNTKMFFYFIYKSFVAKDKIIYIDKFLK